jgi:superfamily II DNA or RNA helicase
MEKGNTISIRSTVSLEETASSAGSRTEEIKKLQQAFDQIVNEVITPVSGELDGRVKVSASTEPPMLVLEHTASNPQGKEQRFRYEIRLGTPRLESFEIPGPNEPRLLGFPAGPYVPKELTKLQDAFRCACIDDPVLYSRFQRREFKLEDYQKDAVKAGLLDLRETKRALLVLGTGAGKTEIAFEIASQELARAQSLDDAAVLFIVNNNIILSEAGAKFDRRFSDVYSHSHAHGGERDTSGHAVFATPGTILSEQELEKFLATKKQVLIIFDEVHHVVASQPDEIIERATEFATKNALDLSILGMTATETRPDLRSVLAYFNDHISFELPASNLTARGFLAPFRYHACDTWLYPEDKAPTIILPGQEMDAERKKTLNSDAAFPHIEKALEQYTLSKDDRRTLIVAPSVELAGQLVAHLNQNPDFAGQVIRLTAEDKRDRESAIRFAHRYEAWKTGAWPPRSSLSNEPVPTIVVAVYLFKEGADAPGVRTIINWADTNSLIVFLQTLGRGLRPDAFKPYLDVVDLPGTFRKVHLLQWLGDVTESGGRQREGGQGSTERDSQFTSVERPVHALSEEVSASVQAFLADVPQTLARRYPGRHYSALPPHEIERLHECLASRLGFQDASGFELFMRELGHTLQRDQNSVTAISSVRKALEPAFFSRSIDFISREPATLLIYSHLLQTIQIQILEFKSSHLEAVFPEFSNQVLEQALTIGSNLALLRLRHFSLSPLEMIQELNREVVEPGKLSKDTEAQLRLLAFGEHESDLMLVMAWVEGRQGLPDPLDQKALIQAYLHHPGIREKLSESDFLLPRANFEKLLVEKGLVKIHAERVESRRQFLQVLKNNLDTLIRTLEDEKISELDDPIARSLVLLRNRELLEMIEQSGITPERFRAFKGQFETIEQYSSSHKQLQDVLDSLRLLLKTACLHQELPLHELPGCSVSIQSPPGTDHISFSIETQTSSGTRACEVQGVLSVKTDFQRPHIILPSPLLYDLKTFSESMSTDQKQELAHAVRVLLEKHAMKLHAAEREESEGSNVPVIIFPETASFSDPLSLESLIRDQLFNQTKLDILIGGDRVVGQGEVHNLLVSITQARSSRVSSMTDDFIHHATTLARAMGRESFAHRLLFNYQVVHFARTRVSIHASQWERLFEQHSLSGQSLRYLHICKEPLRRLLQPNAEIHPTRFKSLKTYCDALDAVYQKGGFTDDSALLLAAWTVHDLFPFGSIQHKDSPFLSVNGDFLLLVSNLLRVHSRGLRPSDSVQESCREILSVFFTSLVTAPVGTPAQFHGVPLTQQKDYAIQLGGKIKEASAALVELLDSKTEDVEMKDEATGNTRPRTQGHPFFNINREAVLFLSGTVKNPVAHLDPKCAVRIKWLQKQTGQGLPTTPVTLEEMESLLGAKEKAKCCPGCKTPTWRDQEMYDDVKKRFRYSPKLSAELTSLV